MEQMFRCVLVDDDPWALCDIKKLVDFEAAGFQIAGEYANATAAMEGIQRLNPSLLITDICLGGANGLELIDACRRQQRKMEYIVISGYADFEYARQAIDSNVCTYLLKPLDGVKTLRALRKAYGRLDEKSICDHPDSEKNIADRICDYIRAHYMERLRLEDVAEAFHLNRSYLSELFRDMVGKNFVQYKNEVRIEQAKTLLTHSDKSVSEIAGLCGFENSGYFSLVFRHLTGKSPGEFRR